MEQLKVSFNGYFFKLKNFIGKNKEMVVYLLNKGADVNNVDRRGQSPLHVSIEKRWEKWRENK